ncbi:MAG: hypothetical protein A3D53_02410 [Candidatus Magasanikbacteria bacterium RIFCSPHIGHO2_02_FULL_45_10]|uniref:Uncharacterized protein n=1 Tax=Candidatus Magasanikbacteria bacterium RIFCSPHIGHO2_02_FULL_45_10 TaxID=1798679 RepID=A0A1F6MBR9_9BACT|nr:MAG: hypothetical protein A3D53_02410 [Candidatus Magasanikbacteria bacterium RIFCSPHIGHO2_02_FULL_45_10]
MSLHRAVAQGTIIQIVGKAISTLLGFVAIALLTRTLGTEQFGWYITASSFLQFVGVLSDFGFVLTTSNMLSEGQFERSRLFNTIFTWRGITAFIFQVLGPLVFLFFPFQSEIKWAVAIMSASFFFQSLNQVFVGLYREQLRIGVAVMGEIASRVALVTGVALVAAGHNGFLWMMGAVSIASLLSTVYYWLYAPTIHWSTDRAISAAILAKMWPVATAVIFNSLYFQAGRIILPFYISQTEVGLFGAAIRVYDIVVQMAALIMGILMPLLTFAWARQLKNDFKERLQLSLNLMSVLLVPLIVGLIVLARPLMILVAGTNFTASGDMLAIIGIALFGVTFGMTFGHVALTINRQRSVLWIYISDAFISFLAFLYVIPHYGWRGAAIIMIFSELYAGTLITIVTLRYAKTIPSFVAFFKIVLASAIMGAVLYLTTSLPLFVAIVLGIITYAVLIMGLRVMTWERVRDVLKGPKIA